MKFIESFIIAIRSLAANKMRSSLTMLGIIIGVGISATDVVVLSTVARWFKKKLGMMTGIVKVGTGLGMFIMPLAADGLISSYGWRNSYMILGIMGTIIVVSISRLLRRDTRSVQNGLDVEKGVHSSDSQVSIVLHSENTINNYKNNR